MAAVLRSSGDLGRVGRRGTRAPLRLGQFDLPDFEKRAAGSQLNPFECGPCQNFDFQAGRCVEDPELKSPPPAGCGPGMVYDTSICLCVASGPLTPGQQQAAPKGTSGVAAVVVVGTLVLVGGAIALAVLA